MAEINIPALPATHDQFLEYATEHPEKSMLELVKPYKDYDAELRKVFAQQPDHEAVQRPNVVPVFAGHEQDVKIRARDLKAESEEEKQSYIMPLKEKDRKPNGSPAIVQSLRDFRTNFNVFSESSLADMDWSNVVAAGSAVVTSLLAVPEEHAESKRALRTYYHEQLAPASDVDLFLYGLTEEQAIEKIKQIERKVRDALLVETTTVRTKNTVTIASQYPTRHVQIVLRIYKSISEILTGFDVDCSCAAYDGSQVWASARALAAYMTQINTVDLTRRSPSYENRLSKYAKRGFEVHWPGLDRSRIDPTIFERSFGRTEGLARLLILEKLPKSEERDAYLDQRREERGRPPVDRRRVRKQRVHGNVKNDHEDEVAEWVDSDEVSDYHTFQVPYGPTFHARKIEKLLFTKDILLNAEWNKPKDREVNLHRHPCFFGTAEDVIQDCCGYCPVPSTVEEEEAAEEESKIYVNGNISFMRDDPGRQAIGSFHPLTADDWTQMAYVSDTGMLCQAIVDGDAEYVRSWLQQDGNDPNARDWTGRAPLHLAVANSTVEIVQLLIDHGARLVARLVDGRTALHLAAMRGSVEMVSALLRKSEANEEEEERKTDAKRAARKAARKGDGAPADVNMADASASAGSPSADMDSDEEGSDVDMLEDAGKTEDLDATTEGSMVNVKKPGAKADDEIPANEEDDEPDVYDVNVCAWDTAASALHLAIINGHENVVKCLVQDHGADVLLPIKLFEHDRSARAAILTLVLALQLPMEKATSMAQTLIQLGASVAQADFDQTTVLEYCVADRPNLLEMLGRADEIGTKRAINHVSVISDYRPHPEACGPLLTAIQARDGSTALKLLSAGAKAQISFSDYMKAYKTKREPPQDSKQNKQTFETSQVQPVLAAVDCELPLLCKALVLDHGADPNTLSKEGYEVIHNEYRRRNTAGKSLLDVVREKLKSLREWKHTERKYDEPTPLQDDESYLAPYEGGSYAMWSAKKQLASAKSDFEQEKEAYEENVRASQEDKKGVEEQQAAVSELATAFEQLETALVAAGGKTFEELWPDIKKPEEREDYRGHEPEAPAPFGISFAFKVGDNTDEGHKKYLELFEAVWANDLQAIKQLTLTPWKDSNGEDQPPLQMAAYDQHDLSTFAIAAVKGYFDVASAILEIAEAQYERPEAGKQKHTMLDGEADDDDDDDDDASSEDVRVYSEIVDDQFTVETIGEVSMQVRSRTSPRDFILSPYPALTLVEQKQAPSSPSMDGFQYFGPRKSITLGSKRTNTGSIKSPKPPQGLAERRWQLPEPGNLIQLALYEDNHQLLAYVLEKAQEYTQIDADSSDENTKSFVTIDDADFTYAVRADEPHLLEELIKRTGAGIPIDGFVAKSGIELKEKPKYYQGLSVHGRKRKDWADASRGNVFQVLPESNAPPLLQAAHAGSLKTVEWFLSDAAMRCYLEFAQANKDDKRLQRLAPASGLFEKLTTKFLATRTDLVISCYLMRKRASEDDGRMLRYLMSAVPSAIDAKSAQGLTPLHIAMELYDHLAVKMLIEEGADQTARDRQGNNILHRLLNRKVEDEKHLKKLPVMIDLIDQRLLPSLFLERSAESPGSVTPLAQWLSPQHRFTPKERDVETLQTLLRYSGGAGLSHINGEGDTPLHVAVRKNLHHLVQAILDYDPSLLKRENATGRTPYEMAEDDAIADICEDPPPLPTGYSVYENRKARRDGLPSRWYYHVTNRAPSSFVEPIEADRRHSSEKIWDLVREVKQKLDADGKAKRRLVTLNEANEVARRLAARKAASLKQEEPSEDGFVEVSGGDEVQAWLSSAHRRV